MTDPIVGYLWPVAPLTAEEVSRSILWGEHATPRKPVDPKVVRFEDMVPVRACPHCGVLVMEGGTHQLIEHGDLP